MGLVSVHIDFETYSEADIKSVGLYNYAYHPSTKVICMAYRIGDGIVKLWRPGRALPVFPKAYKLIAHNVMFELEIIRAGKMKIPIPAQIQCTASEAAMMGYPRSLGGAAKAMRLKVQKDETGKGKMLQVSKPRRPSNKDPATNWFANKEKMNATYRYCINDVVVEGAIGEITDDLCPYERAIFLLDRKVNARGIAFDRELAESAVELSKQYMKRRLNKELFWISGFKVQSVSNVKSIREALRDFDIEVDSLNKEVVNNLLNRDLHPTARRILEIRKEGGLASVAKYKKMLKWGADDDRLRYILMYHGAGTGRWTGKGPQLHNLPQGSKMDKDEAIAKIKSRNIAEFDDTEYDLMDALSSCIRETMTASPGKILGAADFKNIEVRVLAWLAGQEDLLRLLADGGDPYIDMAASIYGVKVEDVTAEQRNIGKMAVLGLGFQMAASTFQSQVQSRGIEMTIEFAEEVVKIYRAKYKKVVAFWKRIEKDAIATKKDEKMPESEGRKYHFHLKGGNLLMNLPSGRNLYFLDPVVERGRYGSKISHKRVNSVTTQWERRDTYGGMLTENIVQATARDLLAEAMLRVEEEYDIVLHIHDELVIDVEPDVDREHFESLVRKVPRWALGLPLEIDTWYQFRYQKG